MLSFILCGSPKGFSRRINYQLFSLILVYICCETEYVRVFCYVSYVLEKPWREHLVDHLLSLFVCVYSLWSPVSFCCIAYRKYQVLHTRYSNCARVFSCRLRFALHTLHSTDSLSAHTVCCPLVLSFSRQFQDICAAVLTAVCPHRRPPDFSCSFENDLGPVPHSSTHTHTHTYTHTRSLSRTSHMMYRGWFSCRVRRRHQSRRGVQLEHEELEPWQGFGA